MVNKFGGGDVDSSREVAITIAEVRQPSESADVVPSFRLPPVPTARTGESPASVGGS